jgi:hypothetical protein
MKEISSIDFPQHGEVFYFYGQALNILNTKTYFQEIIRCSFKLKLDLDGIPSLSN